MSAANREESGPRRRFPIFSFAIAGLVMWAVGASAQSDLRFRLPETISVSAAEELAVVYDRVARRGPPVRPITQDDWDRQRSAAEEATEPRVSAFADALGVIRSSDSIGGVRVLRIRSANAKPSRRKLLYLHGGGYVLFSARSSLIVPSLLAAKSGYEVISIDYTLAPRGDWKSATDEVLAVWNGLIKSGSKPRRIGIAGDSAGGALAAGSVLKMRDRGYPLPGAVYLLSPWSDITFTGDTYSTLVNADPTLDMTRLKWGADAYADAAYHKHPYVSPVYGDYSRSFPPTLIQAGTREIFLSNAVRHHGALQSAGKVVTLEVYEGMPHVFQALTPNSLETQMAIANAIRFFELHLRK